MKSSTKKAVGLTRTDLQKGLEPAVARALAGLDLKTEAELRRLLRALVTIGAGKLLDLGIPPDAVAAYAVEAVIHEVERRQRSGGNVYSPFGPIAPAKA